jgi:four helix bundle protein
MGNTAKEKSKTFALRIIKLYKYLTSEKKEFVLSKQLLRSGTSIGANLVEAERGQSTKDFLSKVYIALKEAAESGYWLELLYESEYLSKAEFDSLHGNCEEIIRMLNATTKTINSTLNSQLSKLQTAKGDKLNSQLSKLQTAKGEGSVAK